MEQLTITISGMSCGHCVGSVSQALGAVPGVAVKEVRIGAATVSYDPAKASWAEIAKAIEQAGYVPSPPATA